MTALLLETARRIVIKTGSALMVDPAGQPREAWLGGLAHDIAALRQAGAEVVLVTSGAVALGRALLLPAPEYGARTDLSQKQAAAALGQPLLMQALSSAFEDQTMTGAQVLLTLEDTERRRRWLNARATLETLLAAGAIPVINENDSVATDELRYGDNDRLAARVAQMISADVLILLSDIDGLYTVDPRQDPTAEHIPSVTAFSPEILAMGGAANTLRGIGSGGMATKLAAAEIAFSAGCATAITLGDRPHPLHALAKGAKATWFRPSLSPRSARMAWLAGHLQPEGRVHIDAGAFKALQSGSSLLPVGISDVKGHFDRGAAVTLVGPNGSGLGKGVVAYTSSEIDQIKGLHSAEVTDTLGYRNRPAVIHRDDLILEPVQASPVGTSAEGKSRPPPLQN